MVKKVSTSIKKAQSTSTVPKLNVLSDVLDTLRFRGSIFFDQSWPLPGVCHYKN